MRCSASSVPTAGKTTLVRILATLLKPDGRRARVAGYDIAADGAPLRSVIGLAGQYAAVDELLTGRENLELVGLWYHLDKREYRRRAEEVLERFSLTAAADQSTTLLLSAGRRVEEERISLDDLGIRRAGAAAAPPHHAAATRS